MAGTGTAALSPDGTALRVEDLVVDFALANNQVASAVSHISFDVRKGETLGIVGESGCGKSSTVRAVLQLPPPTSGSVRLDGVELTELSPSMMRKSRRSLQVILQDPISALNPRRKVKDLVAEGLNIWGEKNKIERVRTVMAAVGLDYDVVGNRLAGEFSGGQCQRISIARALALEPDVLICDEPVSALDVSVQAQIINLLEDLKEKYAITLVFVSHDLSVIKIVSDRVMVMYLGKICELAPTESLYSDPGHPYTKTLFDSIPRARSDSDPAPAPFGEIPSIISPPSGCRFRTRCPRATAICTSTEPVLSLRGPDHFIACHHPIGTDAVE